MDPSLTSCTGSYTPSRKNPQNYMGRLRYKKHNTPLRPIVSSCGSITYNAAKYLASILTPLVGTNCHSIKNTKELVDKLRGLEIPPARKLVSYDVTALFTSVPVDKALEFTTERLHADDTLTSRTEMTIPHIVELLDFCLSTTYFIYDGTYYQQTHGAAMGSPISPLVANCYMEQFEKVAISTAPHPPSLWLRYVDNTFTVLHEYGVEEFTEHINSIDPHIKFTIEPEKNSKLPFLDLCTHTLDDGSTKITIYQKPTHTDQYLNFKSHHPLTHKRSVVRTLTNRAQQYVTTAEGRKSELDCTSTIQWKKDLLTRTTTHEVLCWDYHTWQDYQNSLAGFISHTTYKCTTSRRTPSAR